MASVAGGAVTCERLLQAAQREGRSGRPLIRALLGQPLPSLSDLAQAYRAASGMPRVDPGVLEPSPSAGRLLDPALLRRERCAPLEILEDLCVLAVEPGRAERAVRAVRSALHRDVLPLAVEPAVLDRLLDGMVGPPAAGALGPLPRRQSRLVGRFRSQVLEREAIDALPALERDGEEGRP
jgi:hypothetical protein